MLPWQGEEQQMRADVRQPPVVLSAAGRAVVKRIRSAKLFVFLRGQRHALFDAAFRGGLDTVYKNRAKSHPPVLPACP